MCSFIKTGYIEINYHLFICSSVKTLAKIIAFIFFWLKIILFNKNLFLLWSYPRSLVFSFQINRPKLYF